ncbi:MAG: U32 family peptidase [Planctomycetia bacterium]|nr:U32 family peptidase [Planctomycetia bacterium]
MTAPAAMPTPELLAPAGDWDCARAAVQNGADAVYFGLECGFNARARAANFSLADLPRLMEMLHLRGLKGYATLNTLVFSDELADFARVIEAVATAGVDAVLVQDVGAALLARRICPDLPLHASTQMTMTSAETIKLAEKLGCERVVLARELSIDEIVAIRRQTAMPLEVFVHGALCVAYSGQCLTSESLGGRSANRGQCAQACRLPYDLVCDGTDVDLGHQKYLLSPQDLAAYALAPELIAAGVSSFKIEGRLKTPEYVANITQHYRRAIDAAVASQPVVFSPRDVEEMELSFSRGFSPGWLHGCDHKMLVPATSSAKRGVRLGTVAAFARGRVAVDLTAAVKRGDGVAFDCGATSDDALGGRVYEVFQAGRSVTEAIDAGRVELAFARDAFDLGRLQPGQAVWKTDDPTLTARLRKTFAGGELTRRQPVDLVVTAVVGKPVVVRATLATGAVCEVESEEPAVEAKKHPLTEETLREQFGRLGGTPFELRGLSAEIEGRPMLPLSVLGKLRHALVEHASRLCISRAAVATGTVAPLHGQARHRADLPLADIRRLSRTRPSGPGPLDARGASVPLAVPGLVFLVRSLDQLRVLLDLGERVLYADFADIRQYREAIDLARAAGATLYPATPRIQKPDELGIFALLAKQGPDGVLVRNYAGLTFFRDRGVPVVADFSLNVTNELSAEFFRGEGVEWVTASYDCNREQLLALVAASEPAWLEVVIHQHMPMFHMEHCVFCAVLSPGTNKTNCGRPCDEHVVKLRDRIGVEHPLTADVGCRNTLFNAVPQSAAEAVPTLLARGVRRFRAEFLDESAEEIGRVVKAYRDLLAGRVTGRDMWSLLKAANRVGVTRGTLEERRNPLAIL